MSMHINRLKIDNYGPIRDQDWELEPGMNLFYGLNESGKTLLVESLIKLLLDGDTGDFDAIGRVTGNPAGFLVVETEDGEVQIPDADYTDLFPDDTDTADIRNAFVIRDLDLRRPERQGDFGRSAYLRDVTDRIMGSQTQKIDSVQDRIAEIGDLANKSSNLIMDRQPQKWRSRRNDADELVGDLEDYLEECREEGVLEKAREKRNKEDELEDVRTEISELEKAEEYQKLETGRGLVQDLENIEDDLEAHEAREEEINEYRELRRKINAYRDSQKYEAVDPGTYRKAGYVTAPLFALSLIAAILSPVTGIGVIAGILLLLLLYLGYKYFHARKQLLDQEHLIENANFAGVEGEDLPTAYNAIDQEIKGYEEEGNRLSQKRSEKIGELRGTFEGDHDTLEEWKEEIEAFEDGVTPGDREFDEDELAELRRREQALADEIDGMRRDMEEHRRKLTDFDGDVRDIAPEDYLDDVEDAQVKSVEDLREAIQILEQFVAELNEMRDIARAAIDIYEELEEEEEQEINQLFTEDDFVVDMFEEVTDGNYTNVWYDEGEPTIKVKRGDGQTLTPYELSQGTYDLLYLTIRLKLAEKLLGDDTGFLVLDDAFIHSDGERTEQEIKILEQLADDGWQIVYFSFRDSVRDAVEDADNGNLVELDSLEFFA